MAKILDHLAGPVERLDAKIQRVRDPEATVGESQMRRRIEAAQVTPRAAENVDEGTSRIEHLDIVLGRISDIDGAGFGIARDAGRPLENIRPEAPDRIALGIQLDHLLQLGIGDQIPAPSVLGDADGMREPGAGIRLVPDQETLARDVEDRHTVQIRVDDQHRSVRPNQPGGRPAKLLELALADEQSDDGVEHGLTGRCLALILGQEIALADQDARQRVPRRIRGARPDARVGSRSERRRNVPFPFSAGRERRAQQRQDREGPGPACRRALHLARERHHCPPSLPDTISPAARRMAERRSVARCIVLTASTVRPAVACASASVRR